MGQATCDGTLDALLPSQLAYPAHGWLRDPSAHARPITLLYNVCALFFALIWPVMCGLVILSQFNFTDENYLLDGDQGRARWMQSTHIISIITMGTSLKRGSAFIAVAGS